MSIFLVFFFFFNDTATTEIYTLSLHDALPIYSAMLLKGNNIELAPSRESLSLSIAEEISRYAREQLRSEEHTSELQSHSDLVCRLLLEKKKKTKIHKRLQVP